MKQLIALTGVILMVSSAQANEGNRIHPLSSSEVVEHIRAELSPSLSEQERTESLTMFESLDINRDEQVSFREMRRHPGLAGSFHKLDLNNDGVLNRKEVQPLQDEIKGLRNILNLSSLRII
ncbi:MAG: hypothetical protein OIF55_09320 [Amphritea sp.]|nr:hypothetical protein [Amphritea sp.]